MVRVVARGGSGTIDVPGDGSVACPSMGTGFRVVLFEPGRWSSSP